MQKVALITGGTRGIGAGIATDFATDHSVAVTYNTTPPASDVFAIQTDLSKPEHATEVIKQVTAKFGRLDILINNAGYVAETPVETLDLDGYRQTFEVNLFAPMALLTAALPHLKPGAAVVNISSINARLPALAAPAYSASKAALDTWTKGTAKVLGPRGIRVNAVAPGATERPESPRPQELLDLFLKDTALGRAGTRQTYQVPSASSAQMPPALSQAKCSRCPVDIGSNDPTRRSTLAETHAQNNRHTTARQTCTKPCHHHRQ